MRELGITHLETPALKLSLTPDKPSPAEDEQDNQDKAESETPVFHNVHEHPDTYGGFVPWIKRDF